MFWSSKMYVQLSLTQLNLINECQPRLIGQQFIQKHQYYFRNVSQYIIKLVKQLNRLILQLIQKYSNMSLSQNCVICGSQRCFQSFDHVATSFENVYNLLKQNKIINPQIYQVTSIIHNMYKSLINKLKLECREDEKIIHRALAKYQYSHLFQSNVSIEVLANISGKVMSSFPDKRILPIIQNFETIKKIGSDKKLYDKFQNSELSNIINCYISRFDFDKCVGVLRENLLGPLLNLSQKKVLPIQKINMRSPTMQQTLQSNGLNFRISNVDFDQRTKQMLLSNKRIIDKDIVDNIQMIKKLKITTVELRNNNISELSCKILAFNLKNIIKLDIRGNRIKDIGVIAIAKNLKTLQELFVSQTDICDISAEVISDKLSFLELLWAENNKLTFLGGQMIVNHPKLKVVNLEGNIINNQQAQLLKAKFNRGYITI